ncbi:uncharacterized protein EDB93DRAFT_1252743 [Suillus bovinus]|uniref:uncharacterized protein n=1 Tax=Suillus bovinus TaxID=48563 RepID=UPI001B85C243|nr:uncharacterized protein EDB93DRAFT_1252743 [Suillus bovinus]KAG2140967.1 hypothetical protein EDB93DRAFT_1252743 [Suillus bovinus]
MIRTNSILLNSPTQSPRLSPTTYSTSSLASCSSSDLHLQMQRRIRFAPLPDQVPSTTPAPPITSLESKPKPKPSTSFFRNIFKRSTPTEDASSCFLRRSRSPQPHEFGCPLTRTTSTPTRQTKRPSSDSKPRSSVNSLGSGGGRHTMPPSHFTPPSLPTKSTRRMLNGRVYGSKRHLPTNPFANVRDEPEFVEWGYGGMGSVTGCSDSKYSVLAKGTPALLSHPQAKTPVERNDGVGVPAPDDEDDGSGMGWVKKRRQERERLAKERHATELASTLDTDSRRTSTDRSSTMDSTSTRLSTLAASSAPTTPLSTTDTLPPQDYLQAVGSSPHRKFDPAINSTARQSSNNHPRTSDLDESELEDHRIHP